MTREVLQQALEALENIDNWLPTIGQKGLRDYEADAITAIKAALAQPDQNLACKSTQARLAASWGYVKAQPEQEPQLTPSGIHKIGRVNHDCQHCKEMQDWEAIASDQAMTIALLRSEQEPEQWQKRHPLRTQGKWENTNEPDAKWWRDNAQGWDIRALFTSPPKRQPLTDAQIWQRVNDCSFNRDLHADKFARAIEAAHGIGDKT